MQFSKSEVCCPSETAHNKKCTVSSVSSWIAPSAKEESCGLSRDNEDGKDLEDSILRPACTVVLKPKPSCELLLVVALVKRKVR